MLQQTIQQLAKQYASEFIEVRRHLHANPELSFQEFKTSEFVQQKLKEFGIAYEIKATTGVVGIIKGKNAESRVIALRADMDALPIIEENDISYASTNAGVMHACGHDVHTTCLLGAAKILNETKDLWGGTVKLIFQPGEEKNPGGASLMIKEGVLENPKPQGIIGLHVHPEMQAGKVSFRDGRVMASADELYITVRAKGGHAAAPHLTADPIVAASQLILSLQQVISRNNHPLSPSVLSICAINGGHTTNVIPNEVKLMGTFRAMDEKWRLEAHKLIQEQVKGIAVATGAEIELHIDIGYPCVDNDVMLTANCRTLANEYMEPGNVLETEVRMGAEDFGFYTQQIPGCFFRLGVRNEEKGIIHNVHTSRFNVDESAIETGMGMMAWLGASAK